MPGQKVMIKAVLRDRRKRTTHLQTMSGNVLRASEVIDFIEHGIAEFYTIAHTAYDNTEYKEEKIFIHHSSSGDNMVKYLETGPDATTANNLDFLPEIQL